MVTTTNTESSKKVKSPNEKGIPLAVAPKVVSIDIGYGHVKAVCGDKQVIFPTEIGIYTSKERLESLITSATEDNLDRMIVENNGQIFAVGKSASHADTLLKRIKDDSVRFEADEFRILIAVAVHLTSGGGDVFIATGLPLGYHNKQNRKFKEYLLSDELDLDIKWLSGVAMEEEGGNLDEPVYKQPFKEINVVGASVYPQGISAVYPALMDKSGVSEEFIEDIEEGSYIGLVDIGMRTLDFAVVEMQGEALNFTTVGKLTDMDDTLGYSRFLDMLKVEAEKKMDSAISLTNFERLLKSVEKKGYFKTQKGKYELQEEYDKTRKTVANMIYSTLMKKWGDDMTSFNVIFVLGGGGNFFFEELETLFKAKGINIILVDDAQFANTHGYNIFGNVAVAQTLENNN